ncbi:MAG TPA: bifunctional [glutamine synthetase] adenylyltransferase/[glutamine synthetase]-adenylyl-L-tyrosine phosphorylase [Acidimicrobiales bacterium]|nr:bifunctional [glutamine synthetase] adenylyltransferase/[glutamine synthetase]-adenylyl-L-tyrosine phosphorylase [Acidimicrobiales bacterium]
MQVQREDIWPEVASSADPARAELGLERLAQARPDAWERLRASPPLRRRVVDVMAASPFLTRTCVSDSMALDVLSDLGAPVGPLEPLARWKDLEVLRIAAADLEGTMRLEAVGAALSNLADGALQAAAVEAAIAANIAIIGMGKLGARELNYGSDIDIMLVGTGDAGAYVALVREVWRTDLALRPEGRAGRLVRSLASYEAYWDRWAMTWEFQALLKARPAAGEAELGHAFATAAAARVWGRPLGADDLRSLRTMKSRAEQLVSRHGLAEREIKLGRGGIRDIEFAVQLLQLVHGRQDPSLRAPATLDALAALAAGGYVALADAAGLEEAYRFLRAVEHRLQLFQDQQVHALPANADARAHLARVLGYRDGRDTTALARFEADLAHHQATARAIHERLYFRPLLEAFSETPRLAAQALPAGPEQSAVPAGLAPEAVGERLAAFGFSDARRARDAVVELTHGLSRSSRLLRSMVPLLLDWLSESPDPDLGLLGLRRLTTGPHRRSQLHALFRESPEAARRLCLLLGTSPMFAVGYERHPDQLALLESGPPALLDEAAMARRARDSITWRPRSEWSRGLGSLVRGERLRTEARDVLGLADLPETSRSLTVLAEAVLATCLGALSGPTGSGIAVVAMGRFGGAELAYSSDLDVLIVFDDDKVTPGDAEHFAEAFLKLVNGETPVQRLYELDLSLRPEGRKGSLARSLKAFEGYYGRWAQVWERQALTRGRIVAGDADVGERFGELAREFLWGRPLTDDEVREIRRMKARVERERVPTGEDPEFHLKLGPGSLSDVEWTVQLLQLRTGTRSEGTLDALTALTVAGALNAADADILANAYRFCEATRNRLYLVRGRAGDALPPPGHQLTTLARSLGMTAPELRDRYRQLTRRARKSVERLFYGGGRG